MRELRRLSPDHYPREGMLLLMTVEEVFPDAPMLVADFRDTHALYYSGLDGWVGMGKSGLAMGTGSPELVDGVWYVEDDVRKNGAARDHSPDPGKMELRRIA